MKSLEKATADYEKAKEKMEASKARYETDLKRFKAAEIAKTEAENLEIVKIIRAMDMSIPELEAFKKRMKNELPIPGSAFLFPPLPGQCEKKQCRVRRCRWYKLLPVYRLC